MKNQIATYVVNGVDRNLNDDRLVLHQPGCRFLQPSPDRPHVGQRTASKLERKARRQCSCC